VTTPTLDRETPVRPPEQGRPGRRRRLPQHQVWRPWLLMAPALAVLGVLILWPLVQVVLISFQDKGLREIRLGETHWIGLENYRWMLGNEQLWQTALPNTLVFAATCVLLTVVLGTSVALLLARLGTLMRGVVTTAIMSAWAMPAVTGTYVWVFLFDAREGIVLRVLSWAGVVDAETTNWFLDRFTFYLIATLNVVHHGFPFVAVTVLAALMTLPRETMEAAEIDGATGWQRFWHVTFPMLKPVFAVVTILSTIWDFKVFTQIYLMPGGDGQNREVLNLGTWSYITSFGQSLYGRGAAVAVVLTLLLLAITLVYLRALFKEEEL
jgi:N,N'-diacetylchitobiose transport system permease protein